MTDQLDMQVEMATRKIRRSFFMVHAKLNLLPTTTEAFNAYLAACAAKEQEGPTELT